MWQVALVVVALISLYLTRGILFPPSILERMKYFSSELKEAEFRSVPVETDPAEQSLLVESIQSRRTSIIYRRNEIAGELRESIDIAPGALPVGLIINFTDGIAIKAGSFSSVYPIRDHKVRFEAAQLKSLILRKIEELAGRSVA